MMANAGGPPVWSGFGPFARAVDARTGSRRKDCRKRCEILTGPAADAPVAEPLNRLAHFRERPPLKL